MMNTMNESILNHLFLPCCLPSSADNDFLMANFQQNEHRLLESMNQFILSIQKSDGANSLPNIGIISECIQRWSTLQSFQNISVPNIKTLLEQLPTGSFFPLYISKQNAAILIEIEPNNINQSLVSSWQVLLPMEEITKSVICHYSSFPVSTYRLNNRSELTSKVYCELLEDFMTHTIEYEASYKSSSNDVSIHNVPKSHYVCQWWIQQFKGIEMQSNASSLVQFKKKHRDHIRLTDGYRPFRRSGLWMTIKTVLEIIFTKRFGEVGILIYKLFITRFLTYMLERQKGSNNFAISTDLLVHCIRKIVRRMNKIESKLTSIAVNNVIGWIQHAKQDIETKINELCPKSSCQDVVQINDLINPNLSMKDTNFNSPGLYQHACTQLKTFLHDNSSYAQLVASSNPNNIKNTIDVNREDYIPTYDDLMNQMNYTTGIALTRMEIWVELCLQTWMNRPTPLRTGQNRFQKLLHFFEDYQSAALSHYWSETGPTDPIGYTRFILTSLTIIRCMHEKLCNDTRFERLKKHSIHIPNLLNLFEYLVLPIREDMIRARYLYDYFHDFNNKQYPDLLTKIECAEAFGVAYANQSASMNNSLTQIRAQAEIDRLNKIREVQNEKRRYEQLMASVCHLPCSCHYEEYGRYWVTCHKCRVQEQAGRIKVDIFECPIPNTHAGALAVIFELQMPIEIRSYREVLWQFINRPKPRPENNMHAWLSATPHANKLGRYYTGPNTCLVTLLSSNKSYTESNPSRNIAYTNIDGFLYENGLTVEISPTVPIQFESEFWILTPQITHSDYQKLQFTIGTTEFVQNDVIAKLSECSLRLNPTQFIEYGSFRSGHRLQWWNLLAVLEMDSLPIADESVAILIIHSILQYGPMTVDPNILIHAWCSESHQQLLEDNFIDEMVVRLNHHLDNCELNWQNELVLVVLTLIAMRLLTICNETKQYIVADLIMKCRQTGEKWIELIATCIQNMSSSSIAEIDKLRLKMVTVGITCIFTFSTDQNRMECLLVSSEHVISFLKAATTVHDNFILSKNQSNISTFIQNLMRHSERVRVMAQPTITRFLQDTLFQTLNKFSIIYWTVIRNKGYMDEQWRKEKIDLYDGWYSCQYESRYLSMDCIRGSYLVDGMTVGFLPEKITTNPLFKRVFDCHVFEVQASDKPRTYITKYAYHVNGRASYEFYFNKYSNNLIINETHTETGHRFQLIPHTCFEKEFPDTFVSNHSHWMNTNTEIIDFRPVEFVKADFLDNKPYVLARTTGRLTNTDMENRRTLINQTSQFFKTLFFQYFHRLDDMPYVYMMRDHSNQTDTIIHIHLSRLGIAFQYHASTDIIVSREYSDMRVSKDQHFGTLTGLTFGLLLTPLPVNGNNQENYPYRKLIVPFGRVTSEKINPDHQSVSVGRPSALSSLQYFVFIMNDRLKILQSMNSPTGWLYLALLHAMTAHPLPDRYTGMTGMERAFQLLNSAGCWSDEPFDQRSLSILIQIAEITPKVNYYPPKLTCSIGINWNSNGLPYSTQHFSYYFIAKELIENSRQFNFMYLPTSEKDKLPEIFDGKTYNEHLLKKLYWDYRDSYNPLARLSTAMEYTILSSRPTLPYQLKSEQSSDNTNYNVAYLANDLYSTGTVNLRDCSNQHWLPLSQWLSDSNGLKSIWIGLLKMTDRLKTSTTADSRDDIERFGKMMDFLHYIADRLKFNAFYLQMLKTALRMPNTISSIITYPLFISYSNIERTSVVTSLISLNDGYTQRKRQQILDEVQNSFMMETSFLDLSNLTNDWERNQINALLNSWQNNKKLRLFLQTIQRQICSYAIERFHTKVPYNPQQYQLESSENHYRLRLKATEHVLDPTLLQNAKEKFQQTYTGHFNQPELRVQNLSTNKKNSFFSQFCPDDNNRDNSLLQITNYFKNQLNESWKKLSAEETIQREAPSSDEINECLNRLRQQSAQSWQELVNNITQSNKQIYDSGLELRITPTTLVSLFQQNRIQFNLTDDQRKLLGGILVYWTLEQQLERALHFAYHKKMEDLEKELSTIPHSNWIPSEHVPWLILELEMNITIREMQIKVARHMMQPNLNFNDPTVRNIVMQMNMGEGKTSVILPMLAVSLPSSTSSLVRIIVLRSLLPTNYQSLRCKLGGLINRRIFPFVCRRDLNFNDQQIQQIYYRLQQGLMNCDVVITSPEDILSYDLLTIDKFRREEFDTGRSMLTMQRWMRTYVRDVLDESDEILHVKYQLIYTVGGQQQVDGGSERWKTIQTMLELVKKYAADISTEFNKDVCYKASERKSGFPQFRLQSSEPFPVLCRKVAVDWFADQNYRRDDKDEIISLLTQADLTIEPFNDRFSKNDLQLFLIIRGLLSSEVLLVALKKRYRVNYGVNPKLDFNRLMAVPFRAKDVVADRTEFGHPDVALVLTHLSYYYSGLNERQLTKVFNRLSEEETNPAEIYDQWIVYEDTDDLPANIREWKGVNLKDYQQRTQYVFRTFKYNMLVINYFLNHFVFPREAKQFPHKLVSSAWDLSSSNRTHIITGFSGTNDTQLLLPVDIRQFDLPELQKTDAIVVNNLLQQENENYGHLTINATTDEILQEIKETSPRINVILDVGALFIDGTNHEIAVKWLNLSDKNQIDYVVYFDSTDSIVVCDRQLHTHKFETSPASERLEHCVFYLDEIHTRGTDFKFPRGFRAAVTLGNGLTKDRFVQACMRMRKLGNGHSLAFWSSNEVHQQIVKLTNKNNDIKVIDILRWVYENTIQSTWDGLHHWAAQSLSFQRKVAAFRDIHWTNLQETFTEPMMTELANECLEPEIIDLNLMYGSQKTLCTVYEIHSARYQSTIYQLSANIRNAVLKRLENYGGTKQRLAQLLDEEQQRELEQELEEERQAERPPPVEPCAPILHEPIQRLCDNTIPMMNLEDYPNVFRRMPHAFAGTTFSHECQPESWLSNLWISTELQRVITTKGESLNPFLRPPRWVIVYRNQHIILLSPHEANWLIGQLALTNSPITTLRMLLPRNKRIQSIFVNTLTLTIPPSIEFQEDNTAYIIPLDRLVQLFVFNGTLYFENAEEQTMYCQILSLCPKPRNEIEEEGFNSHKIGVDGFVSEPEHRDFLKIYHARFKDNPIAFVKQIIENRTNGHATITSHVGSIILHALKLI